VSFRMPLSSPKRLGSLRKRLVETREDGRSHCWVTGCPERPGNTSGKGLGRFCRRHLEHYRRHGDPVKASYTGPQLKPYRDTAAVWIRANKGMPFVAMALTRIAGLKVGAGPAIPPRNLRGVSASDKAQSVWARLRKREVAPEVILAAILAVAMRHEDDPQQGRAEYRRVQIAKVLSRMGGGEVKRWPTHFSDPTLPKETVLRSFPASEGRVLRELGKAAETAADFLLQDHIDDLLTAHRQRRGDGRGKAP
jgi:hypothetical protein